MVSFSVSFLFRILNFLLLVSLGIYVFWRYFYYSLKAHMATRQAALNHLVDQKNMLALEQTDLDEAIKQQEIAYDQIRTKLHTWRACVAQTMYERKHEQEKLRRELFERMQQRRANFARERLEKLVIPRAVDNARTQLQQFFATDNHQARYIDSIFKRMQSNG